MYSRLEEIYMKILMYADNTHVKIIRNSHLGRKYPNRTQYTVSFSIVSVGRLLRKPCGDILFVRK